MVSGQSYCPTALLPYCPCGAREAGRVGRAEVVSWVRCGSLRNAARRTRPVSRPLFPDWIRTCSAHPDGDQQGALGPSSPDFTGSARQQSPNSAGPRGFMPREQCKRRSLRPVECRSHPTSSTMIGISPFIEATPAAPADVPTFQRFGALRNPPVWETRSSVRGKSPRSD
jgi:hypothetical protein